MRPVQPLAPGASLVGNPLSKKNPPKMGEKKHQAFLKAEVWGA